MIRTVGDLILELERYPKDSKLYYASKYALLVPKVELLDEYVVLDMDDKCKELLKFE